MSFPRLLGRACSLKKSSRPLRLVELFVGPASRRKANHCSLDFFSRKELEGEPCSKRGLTPFVSLFRTPTPTTSEATVFACGQLHRIKLSPSNSAQPSQTG